jgi:hypothetical protein
MRERREARRIDTTIPLTITLLGTPLSPPPIIVETGDISLEGLSIVIRIKTRLEQGRLVIEGEENSKKMVKYLLLDNKQLALGINILPRGRSINAIGKVRWCYRNVQEGSYYVKAGVLIEEMDGWYKDRWLEFLRATYQFIASLEPEEGYSGGRESVESLYHKKL